MQAARPAAAEESSIRDLVENCLSTDDLSPLLTLMFSEGGNDSDGDTEDDRMMMGASAMGPSKSKSVLPDGRTAKQAIQSCLRTVASEQDVVIQEVCKSNAEEIAACVSDMWHMRAAVDELRPIMLGSSTALQGAGATLVSHLRALDELLEVHHNVVSGVAAVAGTRFMLGLCTEVGILLDQRHLFQALSLLERIKRDQLDLLLGLLSSQGTAKLASAVPPGSKVPPTASPNRATVKAVQDARSGTGGNASSTAVTKAPLGPSGGAQNTSYESLRVFFEDLISQLLQAVEYLAVTEFNGWLVSIRSDARQVGMRAIRKAAIERQLDEDLARERRDVIVQIECGQSLPLDEVAPKLGRSAFRKELQSDNTPVAAAKALAAEGGAKGKPRRRRKEGEGAASPVTAAANGGGSGSLQPLYNIDNDVATLHAGRPHAAIQELLSRRRKVQQQQQQQQAAAAAAAAAAKWTKAAAGKHISSSNSGGITEAGSSIVAASDSSVGLLAGVDMRGLYRCVHIHQELASLRRFQDYYLEQRRLQIASDLKAPNNFMESYQAYLAQVLGFFIVESYVVRQLPKLVSLEQALMMWESAAGNLKSTMEAALDSLRTAPMMVLVKDFTLLECHALDTAGFPSSPIEGVLLTSQARYHDLLSGSTARLVSKALQADELEDLEVRSAREVALHVKKLGLPALLEGADTHTYRAGSTATPSTPFKAPYSQSVPELLQSVCNFVEDSVSYLNGLYAPWELVHAVFQHRDKMITKVIVDALSTKITWTIGQALVPCVMKMVANAWSIIQAIPTLDEWTMTQSNPKYRQQQQKSSSTPTASDASNPTKHASSKLNALRDVGINSLNAALRSVQDAAEQGVLKLVTARVDAALAGLKTLMWLPREPMAEGASAYMEQLVEFLTATFDSAQSLMPRSSFLLLSRSVINPIGRVYVDLFTRGGASVRSYNLFAIQRLASDVGRMQRFAVNCKVPGLDTEFDEAMQLFALLLLPEKEMAQVLVSEQRNRRFPALDMATVAVAMDKYREVAKVGRELTGFPSKKSVEEVARQLRAQILSAGGQPPPESRWWSRS